MKPIQQGEKALAIIGISNVINGKVPRWTLDRMKEFDDFETEIVSLAQQAIQGNIKLGPLKREHDYSFLLERLSAALPEKDIREIQSKFPTPFDDLSSEFIVTLQNTWNHLKSIFPASEYRSFTGAKNLTPTGDKTWAFFSKLLVLNDPRKAFMLISSGAMSKAWAKTVQEFFPTLSEAITEALYAAISAKVIETDGKFRMPQRTQDGLNNWLGRRNVDFEPAPPPTVNPAAENKPKAGGAAAVALSPTQRITDGGNAKNG